MLLLSLISRRKGKGVEGRRSLKGPGRKEKGGDVHINSSLNCYERKGEKEKREMIS